MFRLLTDPAAFANLHWQDAREIVTVLGGSVSDDDIIASDDALAKLPSILGDHTMDELRKIIAARRAKINKELEQLPARIDEVQRGLPGAIDANPDMLAVNLADLQERRKAKEAERTRIETGGEIAEKSRRLAEIKTELLEMEHKSRISQVGAAEAERKALRTVQSDIDGVEREISRHEKDIEDSYASAEEIEAKLPGLREKWNSVDAEVFECSVVDTCPTCGQSLPADQVQEAREKALAGFNVNKADRLGVISADGKALAKKAKMLREEASVFEGKKTDAEKRLKSLQTKEVQLQKRIKKVEDAPPVQATLPPEYAKLAAERDALGMDIGQLRKGNTGALDKLAGETEVLDQEIAVVQSQIARIEQREQGEKRIDELKDRERDLAAEYERLEGELYLCEQFTRTKMAMVSDAINSRFELAEFKMFRELVNGGIEECCEITHKGVPWGSLNHGARTNVGLDIIRTLSQHYRFCPPIFIDNAEAVTKLIPMKAQVIRLVVSAEDKELRVAEANTEPTQGSLFKEVV
ncbi:MAG: hypothetical protein RQM92_09865 [Candidatus Syntrophopropionicum ammoniitolerans]